jgi:hypothetical protein
MLADGRFDARPVVRKTVLFQVINYTFVWSDERMFTAPCFGALTSMLEMTIEDGSADTTRSQIFQSRKRYWLPRPSFTPLKPGYRAHEESSTLDLYRALPWPQQLAHNLTNNRTHCVDCLRFSGSADASMLQPFDFFFFPFGVCVLDCTQAHAQRQTRSLTHRTPWAWPTHTSADNQTIKWTIQVSGADLYTCSSAADVLSAMNIGSTSSEATQGLLPTNRLTWVVDGRFVDAVKAFHPVNSKVETDYSTCVIEIQIKRSWLVVLVKNMFVTLLVVGGGLVALFLHPGEMPGDRIAQLLVSLLIIVTNLQIDFGLGHVTSIMWMDYVRKRLVWNWNAGRGYDVHLRTW